MFNFRKNRVTKAHEQATWIWLRLLNKATSMKVAQRVRERLNQQHIALDDDDILVTEIGATAIALFPQHATERKSVLAVPGVTHQGKRGHLMIHPKLTTWHNTTD